MDGRKVTGRDLSDEDWTALAARLSGPEDVRKNFRGDFRGFLAVVTTGIVCQSGCPARPLRKNLRVYDRLETAFADGFRACKRCKPEITGSSAGSSR